MHGVPVNILIDSGSSSSFVSEKIVQQLDSQTISPKHTSIQVAGGGILLSSGVLDNVTWCIDGYSFKSDLKILPHTHFDLIIVMDWLEQHSPLQIHWQSKWLQFSSQDSVIRLQGLQSDL